MNYLPSELREITPETMHQIKKLKTLNCGTEIGQAFWMDIAFGAGWTLVAGATWGHNEGKFLIWNLNDDNHQLYLVKPPMLYKMAISPDNQLLAIAGTLGMVNIWDLETTNPIVTLRGEPGPKNYVGGVAFSPDGKFLVTGDRYAKIRFWESKTFQQAMVWDDFVVSELAISHDGHFMAGNNYGYAEQEGYSGIIRLWDLHVGKIVTDLKFENSTLPQMTFGSHPDYLTVITAPHRYDGTTKEFAIHLINVNTYSRTTILEDELEENSVLGDITYNPDGTLLAYATKKDCTLLDIKSKKKVNVLYSATEIFKLSFSADGKLLATVGMVGDIHVWGVPINQESG